MINGHIDSSCQEGHSNSVTPCNHGKQKRISACTRISNLARDGLQEQMTALGSIPVSQNQESEAIVERNLLKNSLKILRNVTQENTSNQQPV